MLNLTVGHGKAKSFQLVIRDATDTLVNLTNKTLRFSAKASSDDTDPALISKVSGTGITHAADQGGTGKGLATLKLLPADTSGTDLDPASLSTLLCELDLIQVLNEPERLDTGFLNVEPAVRRSV